MRSALPMVSLSHHSARVTIQAQNGDGGTDLYLGPKAPAGKEANWLATVPGRGYFAIIRLYGPTEAAIDKSWKPGDVEKQ
jgi:hypothetical protein